MASVLFFVLTAPSGRPSIRLLLGFVMLALLLASIYNVLLRVSGLYSRLSSRQLRAVWLIGVILPLLLLMLQSTGQLTVRDTVTLGALFGLGLFYAGRLRQGRS
jgi:hypothetical protein